MASKLSRSVLAIENATLCTSARATNDIGDATPINKISRRIVMAMREKLKDTPQEANKRLAILRTILQYAVDYGLLDQNPAASFRKYTVKPRREYWTLEDQDRFMEAAADLGKPDMARAFLLGLYTAQRQHDILSMKVKDFAGKRYRLQQSKTNTFISIPVTPELRQVIDSVPAGQTYVIKTSQGKPHNMGSFGPRFREVCRHAGIEDLWFRDLRRTAVIQLAEADCTVAEIASMTGHKVDASQRIIDTCFVATEHLADKAAEKMKVSNIMYKSLNINNL